MIVKVTKNMAEVKILKLNKDGTQKTIAVCRLEGEMVTCTGDEDLVQDLMSNGITDYSSNPPKKVFPKDGISFLRQLRHHFKSGYLNATAVLEDKE